MVARAPFEDMHRAERVDPHVRRRFRERAAAWVSRAVQHDIRGVALQAFYDGLCADVNVLPRDVGRHVAPGSDAEVVAGNDEVPLLEQTSRHRRSDEPGGTRDQNPLITRQAFRSRSGIEGANVTSSDARCSSYFCLNHAYRRSASRSSNSARRRLN